MIVSTNCSSTCALGYVCRSAIENSLPQSLSFKTYLLATSRNEKKTQQNKGKIFKWRTVAAGFIVSYFSKSKQSRKRTEHLITGKPVDFLRPLAINWEVISQRFNVCRDSRWMVDGNVGKKSWFSRNSFRYLLPRKWNDTVHLFEILPICNCILCAFLKWVFSKVVENYKFLRIFGDLKAFFERN